jgi:hypothetical protein
MIMSRRRSLFRAYCIVIIIITIIIITLVQEGRFIETNLAHLLP